MALAAAIAAGVLPAGSLAAGPSDVGQPPPYQRIDVPEAGLSAAFPADWHVLTPMARRESEFGRRPEDDAPVYVWTTVFATDGESRWCDIDLIEDFPMSLADHAEMLAGWSYGSYLFGRTGSAGSLLLPAGAAHRIDVQDELDQRAWTMVLLEQGTDRYLLTCTHDLGSGEDWQPIAESIVLQPR